MASEAERNRSYGVVTSYVTHGGHWWNVSTIDRESSSMLGPDRYHETMVWEWYPATKMRGRLVHQDGDRMGSLRVHNAIVERLYLTGQAEEASDGE